MTYENSATAYRINDGIIPPILLITPDQRAFQTADSRMEYYAYIDSIADDRGDVWNRAVTRYSRKTLIYGAGFLITGALSLVLSIFGVATGAESIGTISVASLALAAMFALGWMDTARREQQQLAR